MLFSSLSSLRAGQGSEREQYVTDRRQATTAIPFDKERVHVEFILNRQYQLFRGTYILLELLPRTFPRSHWSFWATSGPSWSPTNELVGWTEAQLRHLRFQSYPSDDRRQLLNTPGAGLRNSEEGQGASGSRDQAKRRLLRSCQRCSFSSIEG